MVGDRQRAGATLENVALVEEGMVVAQSQLLQHARPHHRPVQYEGRGGAAALDGTGIDKAPWRIGRPAMRRRRLDIGRREGCAEEIAGNAGEMRRTLKAFGRLLVVRPRRAVERRGAASVALDLEIRQIAKFEVDIDPDADRPRR